MLRLTSQVFNSGFNLIFGLLIMYLPSLEYFFVFFLTISSLSTSLFLMHWERSKQKFLVPSLRTGLLALSFLMICVYWLVPINLGFNAQLILSAVLVSLLLSYYTLLSSYFALLKNRLNVFLSFFIRIIIGVVFVLFHLNMISIIFYSVTYFVIILFSFYWTRGFYLANTQDDIDLIYLHSVEYPKNQLWLYLSPRLLDFNILGQVYVSRQFLSLLAFLFAFRRTIWFDDLYRRDEVFEINKLKKLLLPYLGSFVLVFLFSSVFLKAELFIITLSWFFLIIVQDLKGYTNRVINFNWFQRSWIVLLVLSLSVITVVSVNVGFFTKTYHVLQMMILIDLVLLFLSAWIFKNEKVY
jgi:hypothetical protein